MKDTYTIEQELDPKEKDHLKWFVWNDGICINEKHPFNTQDEAMDWIPEYEADQAERYWQRMYEDAESAAERNEQHANYQKLK